ncbi:MAG: Coproporphyrinogen dehydrogenase, partial [Bacillales bacterium]|nr:Coproporphyrinogen dehydrogenase [Bacillales bacterium]
MISERLLTQVVKSTAKRHLAMNPTNEVMMPPADPGRKYMLYMH